MKEVRLCTYKGCSRKHYAKGWCSIHWRRNLNHGSPEGKSKICLHCTVPFKVAKGQHRVYCFTCAPAGNKLAAYMLTKYDLSWDEYGAMYFDQDGQCAISSCDAEATVVDHCHRTGKVRSLLCRPCNVHLAWIENQLWKSAAESYLQEYGFHG